MTNPHQPAGRLTAEELVELDRVSQRIERYRPTREEHAAGGLAAPFDPEDDDERLSFSWKQLRNLPRLIAMARSLPDEELVEAYARVIDPDAFRIARAIQPPRVIAALTKARACIALGNQGVVGSPGQDQPSADPVREEGWNEGAAMGLARLKARNHALLTAKPDADDAIKAREHPLAVTIRAAQDDWLKGAARPTDDSATFLARRVFAQNEAIANDLLGILEPDTPDPRVGELILAAKEARRWLHWCVYEHHAPDRSRETAALNRLHAALAAFGGE